MTSFMLKGCLALAIVFCVCTALAAAKTGAKTVLVERDARLGGTTVSAEVLPIGLFHAWNRQVIAGPCWDLVTNAVDLAGGKLPDFPKLDERAWWHRCVHALLFLLVR